MKKATIYLMLAMCAAVTACYEDLGNYDYHPPEEPVVTGLDTDTLIAYVGDSLIITPTVTHSLAGTEQLSYLWEIEEPAELTTYSYEGKDLKIVFGLSPSVHRAFYTITDHATGMKYFYNFVIEGKTEFTTGTLVLSNEGGKARLSFIKPDDTVLPNLYTTIHDGEELPGEPLQLEHVNHMYYPGVDTYWILCGEENNPGVILDPNTLSRTQYITERFFDTPSPLKANGILPTENGVTMGIYNQKLYAGTTFTAPFSPQYGAYGDPLAGDYVLSPYMTSGPGFFLGFDSNVRRFIWFNPAPAYAGPGYGVVQDGDGFDPMNVNMDLIGMMRLNNAATYAFCRDNDGTIYELKFSFEPGKFTANYKRVFAGSALVDANSMWQGSLLEIIYFTSGSKIYRYNPVNEEVKALDADFGGKEVTMIKLLKNGTVLMAGVEGELHTLDVSTGINGTIVKTLEVPGAPVSVVVRE